MRLPRDFFSRDVLEVAPELIGKILVRRFDDGSELRLTINEVEAYRGEEDLGCHASKGRTPRTEVMYHQGGLVYVYLIYGMYWLLNFTTGTEGHPQAVLIRGTTEIQGPGRIGRALNLDKSFYGEDSISSKRLWVENNKNLPGKPKIITSPRIGIDYAGENWAGKHWRFIEGNGS
ncbi:DNA-3-methyladenine glycosylase [Marinilabilia salmonicolor]|jgi:DNA-3-methyladenine glycosylase|uniref:Putative 3-methyladenine DNA glycosylase n=1 Tax=Marinilabilia salmonicolor TaxID=989 RepID=A0A2T0XRX5_9BACT|nr:DNA-3-methyladenine glycosylase [Marinilabilia salmonicolor]PRZ01689.1 DNA-3-methyladenine glycosylase [Marinilabilia salmonicolor]RCW31628.1 DNA-3-methyladenine glycosylase [Marinilabilia salmonicolor]